MYNGNENAQANDQSKEAAFYLRVAMNNPSFRSTNSFRAWPPETAAHMCMQTLLNENNNCKHEMTHEKAIFFICHLVLKLDWNVHLVGLIVMFNISQSYHES